jgi:hypothetical protein
VCNLVSHPERDLRLRVSENKVLRIIFEPRGEEVLYFSLHNLLLSLHLYNYDMFQPYGHQANIAVSLKLELVTLISLHNRFTGILLQVSIYKFIELKIIKCKINFLVRS